jgi:hypothetical protein
MRIAARLTTDETADPLPWTVLAAFRVCLSRAHGKCLCVIRKFTIGLGEQAVELSWLLKDDTIF